MKNECAKEKPVVCVCVLRSPNEQIVFNKYLPGSQRVKQRQTEQQTD